MTELWAAPVATQPVDAVVAIPGSKSATNRALVLAALADSPSVLRRPLRARDTELMAAGLRSLGTSITDYRRGLVDRAPPARRRRRRRLRTGRHRHAVPAAPWPHSVTAT